MDRIEFIEKLTEMIEEQTVIRDTLLKEKEVEYKNSVSYLRKILEEPKSTNLVIVDDNHITMNVFNNSWSATEKKNTTTRVIITQSHTLCKLEDECDNLQKEIDVYKSDAIDKKLPFFRKNT